MSATSFMQLSMVAGEQNPQLPGLVAAHHVLKVLKIKVTLKQPSYKTIRFDRTDGLNTLVR